MRLARFDNRSIPFILFFTTILAYGLLLPQMGFYWDDWPFVWIAKFLGPAEFLPAFANVRPFLGPIFFVTTSLIPPIPLYWQIFALVVRFLSGVFAWSLFHQVWPQHKRLTLIAAFLFLVFPGYSQHWVAFTHINQEWIPFLFYLVSFVFTAKAIRNPSQFTTYTCFALVFLVAGVFPTEYFIGLEPLRFLFLWVMVSDQAPLHRQRFFISIKSWTPYALIWLAYVAWLGYYYTKGSYDSYDVQVVRQPFALAQIFTTTIDAIWKAGFYIWAQIIVLSIKHILAPSSLLAWGLIAASFIFFVFYLRSFEAVQDTKRFAIYALVIGIVGILLGRLPSFAAGLPLKLQSSEDRFMISMMIGGSLFIVGFLDLLIPYARIKHFVFALLIAVGIGQQFFNANLFRRDWLKQQDFFWQLAWRIPALQPNTLLLTDQLPLDYETDLSLTAPINWMYTPDYTRSPLPYGLIFTEKRLGGSLPSLAPNEKMKVYLRTVHFDGSTSQAIVFFMSQNNCLRVLDSKLGDEATYSRQSGYLLKAIPLSNPDLILTNSSETAKLTLLPEPQHTWCYYYTKAELARQQEDWEQVIHLYNEAKSLGYQSSDPLESLVFIEAQVMTGHINAAKELTHKTYRLDRTTRKGLCEVWKRVRTRSSLEGKTQSQVDEILAELQCAR